ncbi:MAG: ATP-dependent helicase, partial [Candidatus Nitrosopelagicus sp.]|nr:ATP-dependent helicase [Candidatus Nitrosopelagicus sp.]
MKQEIKLSKEQQEIIDSNKDTIVVSNPGTGKTTTLSLKVIKLLEDKINPEDILCITFTEKAKKEMFDAIYDYGKGKFSDADIMKINIHTFHSFAYNYLLDAGIISGDIVGNNLMRFSILNSFEQNQALNYGKDYIISTIVPKTENSIRYIKSFGITPDKIDLNKATTILEKIFDEKSSSYTIDEMKSFLKYFIEAYKEYEKSKLQAVDYSDMLLMFKEKFRGNKFQHVLVDEMQDMNEIEAEIATMVAENLFLVGDAKQAIFGFQGGSVKNFQKFMKTCEKKMLSTNRRSSQQILDYSKEYFLNGTSYKEMFQKELSVFKSLGTGEIPKIVSTSAHLSKVLEIIEENQDKSIGIITRTNGQIIKISKFLDSNNIEYSSTSSQASAKQAKIEIQSFIKGLLSDRIEDKISATFTIFAPYSLKEAFEFSKALKKKEFEKLSAIKSWGVKLQREELDQMFGDLILPMCVSKGAEWFSAAMTVKQEIDEYLTFEIPTLEGLFDFISIGEESYIEQKSESKITLTTVHKSKGRAFDVVVYIPSNSKKTSFIDSITKSILSSSEIEVESELTEETLRVDFVAFTRAKQKLVVIVDDKESKNYHIEDLSDIEADDSKDELVATKLNNRLSEAYSLFIAKRFDDSEKLLEDKDEWLEDYIKNYFETVDHFSYSSIKTNPYDFLSKNIINMPRVFAATDFGSEVHDALENILTGKTKISNYQDDVKKATQNGLDVIEELKKEYPGLVIDSTEKHIKVLLSSLTDYNDGNMQFTGYIDAVFKHDNGYLIVDYKTDKQSNYASEHNRQLAVYKKTLAGTEGVPEEQ